MDVLAGEALATALDAFDRPDPPLTEAMPWRAVSVGRTQRTLPAWLRPLLEVIHRRCRGPDCDRPVVWSQAHHLDAWAADGHTDLNRMIPLCQRHHDLVTLGLWDVDLDLNTGVCTWENRSTGSSARTHPPPRDGP